jgi:acetyl esterase/lipase
MQSTRRWLSAGMMALCVSAVHAAPPVADFFRRPLVRDVTLSPSGRYLAVEAARDVGRVQISVLDTEHPDDRRIVAGWGDVDAVGVQWVSDERLMFAAVDLSVNWDDWRSHTQGWMAVDRDGARLRPGVMGVTGRPVAVYRDGSPNVVVMRNNGARRDPLWSLWRVNTRTGYDVRLHDDSPPGTFAWIPDENMRIQALAAREDDRVVLYRPGEEGKGWVKVLEQPVFGVNEILPLTYRHGQMYVLANTGEAGQRAVFTYDLVHAKPGNKPVAIVPGYDFTGSLLFDDESGRLIGIRHLTEDWGTTWLDAGMQAIQKAIDQRLPGLVNEIVCTRCLDVPRLVVLSYSDRQPANYFLYERKSAELKPAAPSRPWIDMRQMGRREMKRFTARDGLPIPITITYPPDAKEGDAPRPAVVLIHGGPWTRGARWGWSEQPQFLASRGYIVLEPEFRGSSGFGDKHLQAGFKQWGMAMGDDIADTATWATGERLIDAKRVCVAGGGYGGYATLMALARHQQLFRCGVSWSAPTELDALYEQDWYDPDVTLRPYGLPLLLGDRKKDAEQLRATSPLTQAARITQPLLLAHGGQDRRVPIEHGKRLRDALAKTNPNVEWVEYRTEGQGWFLPENQVDFWTRVERFLGKQLSPDNAVAP